MVKSLSQRQKKLFLVDVLDSTHLLFCQLNGFEEERLGLSETLPFGLVSALRMKGLKKYVREVRTWLYRLGLCL